MQESFSFGPVFDRNSKILILGSFPSVQSRMTGFYYANPQNRFWHILAAVYQEAVPETVEEKRALLLSHGLILQGVLERCEIQSSSDTSIRGAVPVGVETVMGEARIRRVLMNSTTAARYYACCLEAKTDIPTICLPSTNPASASYRLEYLMKLWGAAPPRKEG